MLDDRLHLKFFEFCLIFLGLLEEDGSTVAVGVDEALLLELVLEGLAKAGLLLLTHVEYYC